MEVKIQEVTRGKFAKYGRVVDIPTDHALAKDILKYWRRLAGEHIREEVEATVVTVEKRELILTQMERHLKTPQMVVPINCALIVPVAPPRDPENPEAVPEAKGIEAFYLPKTKYLILKEGVWHWSPFPRGELASFIVIFKKDTSKTDAFLKKIKGDEIINLVV